MKAAPRSAVRSLMTSSDSASAAGRGDDGGWIDKVDYMDPSKVLQSDTNWVDTYVVRGALTWQPTAPLIITPSVFYQNRDQNNIDDYWVGISDPDSGDYKTGTPENMADKDHFMLSALKADYDFGGAELISNTSYLRPQASWCRITAPRSTICPTSRASSPRRQVPDFGQRCRMGCAASTG